MITILAVGKKHESWIADGLQRYQKRLQGPWKIEWALTAHSALQGQEARQDESRTLLAMLKPNDFVILLDERGKEVDSPALSKLFEGALASSRRVVCIIGGAYGVSDDLLQRADTVWSLSPLVFPHQLVRLMLVEQIYRAQSIATGHPYHHE